MRVTAGSKKNRISLTPIWGSSTPADEPSPQLERAWLAAHDLLISGLRTRLVPDPQAEKHPTDSYVIPATEAARRRQKSSKGWQTGTLSWFTSEYIPVVGKGYGVFAKLLSGN
ncbi:hypothetical protein CIHG_06524 [Coccidioides immitis H538.4]|uniref:Uncharacterized protein n=1 Tax=Coccidioides immitis H538.4 TaxID=396776 RepID=A0A0J8RVJ1_COCIT|nr:hypothetical protein CIHG_06524 [Coccidioides immitis H538.4]